MYAVVDEGGRQLTLREGETVWLDYRPALPGEEIRLDRVLMLGGEKVTVGTPTVAGASVSVVVKQQVKGPKLRGNKRRLHDRSQNKWGHRQRYTLVEIRKIVTDGDQ